MNDGRRLLCDSQIFSFCLKLGEKLKGTGKSGKHLPQNDVDPTKLNIMEQQSRRAPWRPSKVPTCLNVQTRICLWKSGSHREKASPLKHLALEVLERNTKTDLIFPQSQGVTRTECIKDEEKVKDNHLPKQFIIIRGKGH